ncbi:MAG: hypothetical protein LBJ12_01715 [Oscillospiraceae bacterium]|jgi:hypothetical protein|nr:hypothetical protein [Oscillospiraceae bacterium]
MYEVEFYRDKNGKSEIVEYLDELKEKGETSKNERVNRDKILAYTRRRIKSDTPKIDSRRAV